MSPALTSCGWPEVTGIKEPKVIRILRAAGGWLPRAALINLYCENGASEATAINTISRAYRDELIERRGPAKAREYRLTSWCPAEVADGRTLPRHHKRPGGKSGAYVGPVPDPDRGPPIASLGTVCRPEAPPPDVADMLDHIGRRFYEYAHNVE